MPVLKFTLHKSVDERYYFRLRNIGEEILFTSRCYNEFRNCINDIHCLYAYKDFNVEEDYNAKSGQYRFSLRSTNGIIIAQSPFYRSKAIMLQDLRVICEAMHEAEVEDRSTTVRYFRKENTSI